jgi:tetratricopeptide (TPR) repeat protein
MSAPAISINRHPWTSRLFPGLNVVTPVLLVLCVLSVFLPGLFSPFTFDDHPAIVRNHAIRHLDRLGLALSPPDESPIAGRPIVNLSLAIDFAIYSLRSWGFRLTNILIHLANALLLWGVLRRSLSWPRLAAALALLWAVLPLNTEAVVYLTQRTELLMATFYLLTLYAFIRGTGSMADGGWRMADGKSDATSSIIHHPSSIRPRGWLIVSVLACALGMLSKEVMVSAPIAALLYDRAFVAGSFRTALRRRWGFHLALLATWGIMAAVLLSSPRDNSVGAGLGLSSWTYLLTQTHVIVHYVKLVFFPFPLAVAHDWPLHHTLAQAWPWALPVTGTGLVTLGLLCRRPRLGFVAACFFMILAPSSSFVPIVTEIVAERRMYLPSACVLILALVPAAHLARFILRRLPLHPPPRVGVLWAGVAVLLIAAMGVSLVRVRTYRSNLSIWRDVVDKFPDSRYGITNYGFALSNSAMQFQALGWQHEAVKRWPNNVLVLNNYAATLMALNRTDEGLQLLHRAVALQVPLASVWINLGSYAQAQGDPTTALEHFHQAADLEPYDGPLQARIALVLHEMGRDDEARTHLDRAIDLRPEIAGPYDYLGVIHTPTDPAQARKMFDRAIRLEPGYGQAYANRSVLRRQQGDLEGRWEDIAKAVELEPRNPTIQAEYGAALAELGKLAQARDAYHTAIDLLETNTASLNQGQGQGDSADQAATLQWADSRVLARAYDGLAAALTALGQPQEALPHFDKAIALAPHRPDTYYNLGVALTRLGRLDDAVARYRQAIERQPDYAQAHVNLGNVLAQRGDRAQAIAAYRSAIAHRPDYAPAWGNLADTLAADNDLPAAVDAYHKALDLDPDNPRTHNNLGIVLARRGDLPGAMRHFERAVALRPGFADAQANLARAREMMNPAAHP